MGHLNNKPNRAIFWGLTGSMLLLSVGIASFAVVSNEGGELSVSSPSRSIFPSSIEAHAAPMRGEDESSGAEKSPLLSAEPEYDVGGLVLDEIVPEEDSLEGARLAAVRPLLETGVPFSQPLPVRSSSALPLVELEADEFGDSDIIEKLLSENGAADEEKDELPWIEHTVARGERLVEISRKYGIFVATIGKANDLKNFNRLSQGQTLLIPRTEEQLDDVIEERKRREEERQAARKKADPIEYKSYTVKNGDSLWTIANANNLSVDSLYGTNVMKNPDRLVPGMALRIPNQDGLSVKIARGQTLAALAKKYDVTESAIRMANRLDAKAVVKTGTEIFIPGASQAVVAYRRDAGSGGLSGKAVEIAHAPSGFSGRFTWPVSGKISSPFGWRRHPIAKLRKFHTGIDIIAPRHTPIKAAQSGQVIFSGWMSGYGRTIVIRHSGSYTTLYAHAQTLNVRKGQNVAKGQKIASVGTSGRSTGPHLHFEVRINDKPSNPIRYLR